MNLTQLRNATIIVAYDDCRILVDPMLADQGAIPPFKWLVGQRRRNPIVPLPDGTAEHLIGVTHALITHCRKGHVDHLDRAGCRWLRERGIPVLCMPDDATFLARRGLNVQPLNATGPTPFHTGSITPIRCLHGEGWISRFMVHGYGYYIEQTGEPSLYLAGDTVLTDEVRRCILERRPAVSVVPAGGASMDFGAELIMDDDAVLTLAALGQGIVIANHLEALDHCPVSRATLLRRAQALGLAQRLRVPDDGEMLAFAGD
ncbi:MBL fold metallo-hydrolase [Chitiniphilus eburneus]|uniref:MBL fold metallo-hydrolase n=1 Tax=Chitiniphilus eburneus TaxID=2571148 RepID=A0A4U0PGN8_9NEIS|nr:MBL fold metallo-hydrolase [Chitiniphilus eburneus]TJZ67131.1 MBL fold metallo-hydrolase [Chitiniphilus eburneus]